MKTANFSTATNGFPLESDATLGFMQTAYVEAATALAKMKGDDMAVISGMAESGNSVAPGWIMLGGEFIEFMGGTKTATFIIVDTWLAKANQDGQVYDRYLTRKAQFGTGTTQYNYADLQRAESILTIRERLVDLLALENEVIIKGCEISALTVSTLTIAAGIVVIGRKILTTGSYSGAFPVYLKGDGTYTATLPAAPFIKFDPHTSQRFADVQRRAVTPIGHVSMQAQVDADRFDPTGLGRQEWKGFAFANGQNGTVNMQGRFPIGRFLNGNSGNPIWDANYEDEGNVGGEKTVGLTIAQLPSHNHTANTVSGGVVPPGDFGLVRRSESGEDVTSQNTDTSNSGSEPDQLATPVDIPFQGSNAKHENRPPYMVLVFIQRIN